MLGFGLEILVLGITFFGGLLAAIYLGLALRAKQQGRTPRD